MKKLSLLIAVGSFVFLSIAKPTTNVSTFDSYSQQMQAMASKYVAEQKFENANKAVSSKKWLLKCRIVKNRFKFICFKNIQRI